MNAAMASIAKNFTFENFSEPMLDPFLMSHLDKNYEKISEETLSQQNWLTLSLSLQNIVQVSNSTFLKFKKQSNWAT